MDITLYTTEHGSGDPLILLHGNGENQGYFVHQIGYFSQFYRVIAVDTRGHGQSPRGTAPFTISQFADDLFDLMEQMALEKAHILGFSDGGNIALTFALRHPDRVDKLILNGANLFPSGLKPLVSLGVHAEYLWAKCTRNDHYAALMQLMRKEPSITPEELRELNIPALVIAGNRDMIKDSHTRLMAASLTKSELAILPGDHFIAKKTPDAFNRIVHRFLEK